MPNYKEMITKFGTGADQKFNSLDLSSRIEETKTRIEDSAKNSDPIKATINDHFNNSITGAGNADVLKSFNSYGFSNDSLNFYLWLALYNDSWVFRRAIDKPAQDEVNAGITINGSGDWSKLYKAYNNYKPELTQLLMWGALFGGSIAVMMFENISDEEMKYPIDKTKIKNSPMKMYVTDRWYGVSQYGTDTVTNMRDIDFGKPKMYNVTFSDGKTILVHHDYVLRYEHRTAPKLIKNGQLQGWGYAEGAHIINELARDDQLKAAITTLINKCNIEVIKMKGMKSLFMGADKENEEQLTQRLEMVQWGRNYNSLTFLDTDDGYEHFEFTGISGLSNIMEQNMWLISAALEMQGVLFGDLKGGLSETNDSNKRYGQTIHTRCDTYFRPIVKKFLKVMAIVYDINDPIEFSFNYINQDEMNEIKMKSLEDYSRVLNSFGDMGIISKYQIAQSIIEYINNGAIKIAFTDEEMQKLKYEEEQAILDTYKKSSKAREILNSEFGSTPDANLQTSGFSEKPESTGVEAPVEEKTEYGEGEEIKLGEQQPSSESSTTESE